MGASVQIDHPFLGSLELPGDSDPDGAAPMALFCENDTNTKRLYGVEPITAYPKEGINDHVIKGAATVNPQRRGTKCAFWYQVTVAPGATINLRLRLRPAKNTSGSPASAPFGAGFMHRHDMADRSKLNEGGLLRGEPGRRRLLNELVRTRPAGRI